MERIHVFDEEETRAGGHAKAFALLTPTQQATVRAQQNLLQFVVDMWNPGRFVPISGWRSSKVNSAVGGSNNSLHLWGLARDFAVVDGESVDPPRLPKGFRVIRSKGTFRSFHVQFNLKRC